MRRLVLISLLAVLGFAIGEQLNDLKGLPLRGLSSLAKQSFRRVAHVGQNLVAAHSSPDGNKIVGLRSEGDQWSVCAYSFSGEELLAPIPVPRPTGFANRIAWSEDGKNCAVAAGSVVLHLNFEGEAKATELGASWQVREVRFCGPRLMARADGFVYIWNGTTPEWRVQADDVLHADLSKDGRLLALGITNSGVYLIDLSRRQVVRRFDERLTAASVRFCAQDKRLMTAYRIRKDRERDNALVYDLKSGRPVGPRLPLSDLANCWVSSDGSRIMAHSEIGRSVWDTKSGKMLSNPELTDPGKDAFSPDGRLVATSQRSEAKMIVWDASSGKVVADLALKAPANHLNFATPKRLDATGGPCAVWEECRQ